MYQIKHGRGTGGATVNGPLLLVFPANPSSCPDLFSAQGSIWHLGSVLICLRLQLRSFCEEIWF